MSDQLDRDMGPDPVSWREAVGFGVAVVLWFVLALFI